MGVTPRSKVAPPRPEAAQAVGDALISQEGLAELLGKTRKAITHMRHRGQLPAPLNLPGKAIRWRASTIRSWIDAADAMTLAGIDLRDALADLRDAERDLEVERREAAKARQRLADAINSMSSARDMTGDPNVARYLAIAIEQAEFPLPLAEVMR